MKIKHIHSLSFGFGRKNNPLELHFVCQTRIQSQQWPHKTALYQKFSAWGTCSRAWYTNGNIFSILFFYFYFCNQQQRFEEALQNICVWAVS